MEFKDINNILNESNALRRAYTAPLKNSYIIDLKAKPVKKIIVRNDAAKKLTTKWDKYRDPTDSLRKIMLDPTPKGYGGNGVYGVWEAVKGHEDLYADTTSENGIKWSFTELWLTEKGAQKLQNNIMPLPNEFYKGESEMLSSYNAARRRKGLKYAAANKEKVTKDMKKLGELRKAQETDDKNWMKYYDKEEEIRKEYANTGIQTRGHQTRGRSPKTDTRYFQISDNFRNLDNKLEPYLGNKNKYSDEAWELVHKIGEIRDEAQEKKSSKEVASKIDKIKKEVDTFIKNHPL